MSSTAYNHLGISLYYAGRFEDAEAALRKSLELAPGRGDTLWTLGALLLDQDRLGEADEVISRQTELGFRLSLEATRQRRQGEVEDSNRLLAELIAKRSETAAYQIAQVYADRRDADATFDWLRRAHRDRDAGLTLLVADPWFAPFHRDPRWAAFLEDVGLPR